MGMIGSRAMKPMTPAAVLSDGFQMPGIISGYGGGTFNMDGAQATAPERGLDSPSVSGGIGPQWMPQLPAGNHPGNVGGYAPPSVDGAPMTFEGVKPAKPQGQGGFFRKGGPWIDLIGAIGDGLSGKREYANSKMQRMQMDREDAKLQQDRQWQIEDRNWKASQPEFFTSGRNRVKFNPLTGDSQVVYNGPEDFDEYATALGMEPGSDEYEQAVTDYVLRGHGPTALGNNMQLDDRRTSNDKTLETLRAYNRGKLRQTPTYRDKNPPPPRSGRKATAPAVKATNPKTGEVITLNSRGQWVDKTGNPVK